MAIHFSEVLSKMKGSDLGPLLALTAQPDIISFAGGLPAPRTFPLKELTEVAVKVREEDGAGAMQYGPSLGFMGLRQAIADRMNRMYCPMGMDKVDPKNIMITTGSQQGLDITGRVFIDKDDVVLIESPSYLGAIGAFALEQPKFVEVPTDDQGMIPEELDKILATTDKVKFIYVIPNYQNPTGICWSLERRQKFMEVVTKYEIPVFEDNPYGDLRFEPKLKNKRKNTIPKRFTTCGIVRLLLSLSSISVFTTSSLVFPSSSSGLADTRASTRSVPISSALLFPN